MCITTDVAELNNTQIYVGEAIKDNKYVHVLAYQNTAKSNGPNAMILPFPTKMKMGQENIIDTREFSDFLDDISEATRHRTRSFGRRLCATGDAIIFDIGSYTVILASHVKYIPLKLKEIGEDRRPKISAKFLLQYGGLYVNKPVALCCWNGTIKPEPLLWWYEPEDKDNFFIPTMDAHDGNPPDLNAQVITDHIISVGSAINDKVQGSAVRYNHKIIPEEIITLLPHHVHGYHTNGLRPNGDMFASVNEVKNSHTVSIKRGISLNEISYSVKMNGWS